MAIKINNKDLYRRVINGQDVQRVILNGSQIRPTSQGHIDYHVISKRGTGGGGGGGGTGTPGGWSTGGGGGGDSVVIGENWVSNGWNTAGGSHGTAKLKYDGMPSLLNAYKVEIIYSFYWNQTDIEDADGKALDSYLAWGDNRTYTADIYEYGQAWAVGLEFQLRVLKSLSGATEGDYIMTVVLDLQNKEANLTLQGPDSFSQRLAYILLDSEVYNIRHSDKFLVILNDGVRLSRTDFFVYNNPPSQPVGAGVYHNGILGVISLSSDGTNWMTIADKNLGATMVWNQGDSCTDSNCGGFFQWGNNYMFPFSGAETTSSTQVDASTYGPGNYYSNSTFIIGHDDWSNPSSANLWGNTTGTDVARKGPCDDGFHVPNSTQVSSLFSTMDTLCGSGNWNLATLKIPPVGIMNKDDGTVVGLGAVEYYWTSTSAGGGYAIKFPQLEYPLAKAYGFSIRPFANTPVVPDSTRTVLYQPS